MKKNPLVSVIVPVYNIENYLEKSILSIIEQEYTNLEIIIINDGSTDNSLTICEMYAAKDTRIQVISQENGGLSSARNSGLDLATGEYILFVDSDDSISRRMLQILVDAIINDESDLVICNYRTISVDEEHVESQNQSNIIKHEIFTRDEVYLKIHTHDTWCIAWNKLYKREIFMDLRYPKGKIHEDEYIIHEVYEKCNRISVIPDQLYYYYKRDNSIVTSFITLKRLDAVRALLNRGEFFYSQSMDYPVSRSIERIAAIYTVFSRELGLKKENRRALKELKQQAKLFYFKTFKRLDFRAKIVGMLFLLFSTKYFDCILTFLKRIRSIVRGNGYLKTMTKEVAKKILFVMSGRWMWRMHHLKKSRSRTLKNVIVMATPCHGNLGDHAITYAQKKLFQKYGQAINLIEISNRDYFIFKTKIKKIIQDEDIVVIDGGGNLGTLWPYEDSKITEIIECYQNNKIVVFPQTCYYDDSLEGYLRLNKNKEVYSKAKDLTICLRDKVSYNFCVKNFLGPKFVLLPDVVMSLDGFDFNKKRKGILLCLRKDKEKVVDKSFLANLEETLKVEEISYRYIDTCDHRKISSRKRKQSLFKIWKNFASSRLVITDRLHGMIFAAITKTPCLALDNISKKVSGVGVWIAHLDYIKVCTNSQELLDSIDEFYAKDNCAYEVKEIKEEYSRFLSLF